MSSISSWWNANSGVDVNNNVDMDGETAKEDASSLPVLPWYVYELGRVTSDTSGKDMVFAAIIAVMAVAMVLMVLEYRSLVKKYKKRKGM